MILFAKIFVVIELLSLLDFVETNLLGASGHAYTVINIQTNNWVHAVGRSRGDQLVVYCRIGESKDLSKIWKRVTLKFNFNSTSKYELFEDWSADRVIAMYEEHRKSWFHFWPVQTREVNLHLFNATCIGVATQESYRIFIEGKAVYSAYLICSIAAVILFHSASKLSKNVVFYYGTGVSIGVLASLLIIFYILSRLVPGRKAGFVIIASGFSTFLAILQHLWRTQALVFLEEHYHLVVGYILFSAIFSFTLLYWFGPPTNPRSHDLVKWMIQVAYAPLFAYPSLLLSVSSCLFFLLITYMTFVAILSYIHVEYRLRYLLYLQGIALSLLYYSIQVREAAVSLMVCLVITTVFPYNILHSIKFRWHLRFPPKRRLLTVEEFEQEADEYTRKALNGLRDYCRSPDCNTWKTVSRLKSPSRFAEFVEGSYHLNDDELLNYDSADSNLAAPMTSDEDSDSALDFRLGS